MADQLRTTSAGSHLKNRRIFTGSQSTTWQVPEGTTEVAVHVWGGGGSSCGATQACCPFCGCPQTGAAGGGGGYSRAIYSVTDADTLSITVGGSGGTSSVTIPTQTPGSPLSALGGGSASSPTSGGIGGSGSVTLNPTFPTYYCMTASGGSGGAQCSTFTIGYGGGGAAGSPLGPGGNGMNGICSYICCSGWNCRSLNGGAGGGIGGSNGVIMTVPVMQQCGSILCLVPGPPICLLVVCATCSFELTGGSALQTNAQIMSDNGQLGNAGTPDSKGNIYGSVGNFDTQTVACNTVTCGLSVPPACCSGPCTLYNSTNLTKSNYMSNTTSGVEWFYVEDIIGSSGYSRSDNTCPSVVVSTNLSPVGDGAGGAGGVLGSTTNAGFLGGGGGRGCDLCNNPASSPGICPFSCGGCAGGAGATCVPVPGTPGAVIIYW